MPIRTLTQGEKPLDTAERPSACSRHVSYIRWLNCHVPYSDVFRVRERTERDRERRTSRYNYHERMKFISRGKLCSFYETQVWTLDRWWHMKRLQFWFLILSDVCHEFCELSWFWNDVWIRWHFSKPKSISFIFQSSFCSEHHRHISAINCKPLIITTKKHSTVTRNLVILYINHWSKVMKKSSVYTVWILRK